MAYNQRNLTDDGGDGGGGEGEVAYPAVTHLLGYKHV